MLRHGGGATGRSKRRRGAKCKKKGKEKKITGLGSPQKDKTDLTD